MEDKKQTLSPSHGPRVVTKVAGFFGDDGELSLVRPGAASAAWVIGDGHGGGGVGVEVWHGGGVCVVGVTAPAVRAATTSGVWAAREGAAAKVVTAVGAPWVPCVLSVGGGARGASGNVL